MGTYDASKFRTALKRHDCADCLCVISKGTRYLAYKPGLHSIRKLCLGCALKVNPNTDNPIYRCPDVENALASARAACSAGTVR